MGWPGQRAFGPPAAEPLGDPVYVPVPYPGEPGYRVPVFGPGGIVLQPPAPRPGRADVPRPARTSPPALGWALFALGIAIAVSVLLPWATVYGVPIDGTAGDGTVTAMCALVIAGAGFLSGVGYGRMGAALAGLAAASLVTVIAIVDISDVDRFVAPVASVVLGNGAVTTGPGLWLALIAGIAASAVSLSALTSTGHRGP